MAQACGGFDQRVEHRLQLDGRATDDLEHVASRGELVNRTREFGLAVAQLFEESRILDRDHRLIGEAGGQLDLFVRKRLNSRAANGKYTQ